MSLGVSSRNGQLWPRISIYTVNGENAMDPYLNLNLAGATNLMLGRNELEETTVTTNAYSGQFGQQAGVQVNYVTRSGTNQLHGNAIYWWTGRAMDANDWFNKTTVPTTPRPFANNNQWAASLGGRIRKDKVFFFVDNEGVRYIVPSVITVFSPSPQFANATLNNLAMVSPASVPLYSRMFALYQSAPGYTPQTAVPGGGCQDFTPSFEGPCFVQYQATPGEPGTEWMQVGRLDVNFSDVDRVFFRVSIDHGTQATYADPINTAFSAASYQPLYNGQTQWTHIFGSNATNTFIAAGSYYRFLFTQNNAPATFPIQVEMSGIGYTSMASGEFYYPQGRNATQYQSIDDYSLTTGNHTLKVGADWRRYDITDYDVSSGTNGLAYVNSVTQFYNGQSLLYDQYFPSRYSEPIALWGIGLYAQDEWRLTRNLRITMALRMEKNSDPVCQTNCAAYFNGPFYSESTDPETPYDTMIRANQRQLFPATNNLNWAPRFGFTWSLGSKGRSVVRGGIGIFYDAFPAILGTLFINNPPNIVGMSVCCGVYWADTSSAGAGASAAASATAIKSGFANGASFSSLSSTVANFSAPNFYNLAGTYRTPRYQKWSLQLEQQLDSNTSISLAYVGNHGLFIPTINYLNIYGSGVAGIPSNPHNPSFATAGDIYSVAVSNYNGATASYNRRLTYGLAVQANYTWGHAFDEASNGGVEHYNSLSSRLYQVNPACLACNNYGSADYDIRNSFNAAYVWTPPFRYRSRVADQLLGNWTLSQNFFARSGLPFTVIDNTTYFNNYGSPPAQVIAANGQLSCRNGSSPCLNPTAFESATAYGAFPTQTRNQWRGPSFFDSDLSITKNAKLTERFALRIGANFYNVFNHPNFTNPNSFLSKVGPTGIGQAGGSFGMITGTTTPPTTPYGSFFAGSPSGRIIQFQSQLMF